MNTFGIEHSVSSWYGMLIMSVIGMMSLYMVALFVVRLRFFQSIRLDSDQLLHDLRQALAKNDTAFLSKLKGQRAQDPPVLILVNAALAHRDADRMEILDALRPVQVRQRERLERGLSAFGTTATIAPFLGLLATVLGIIESFHNLAESGAAGPNVVASGVAAALWGTAAGLFVAIPAVVAYNIFSRWARAAQADMDAASRELSLMLQRGAAGRLHLAAESR